MDVPLGYELLKFGRALPGLAGLAAMRQELPAESPPWPPAFEPSSKVAVF